jgi:hypothetical protein
MFTNNRWRLNGTELMGTSVSTWRTRLIVGTKIVMRTEIFMRSEFLVRRTIFL